MSNPAFHVRPPKPCLHSFLRGQHRVMISSLEEEKRVLNILQQCGCYWGVDVPASLFSPWAVTFCAPYIMRCRPNLSLGWYERSENECSDDIRSGILVKASEVNWEPKAPSAAIQQLIAEMRSAEKEHFKSCKERDEGSDKEAN